MQMPETPLTPEDAPFIAPDSIRTPESFNEESNVLLRTADTSKKHDRIEESDYHPGPPLKRLYMTSEREMLHSFYNRESKSSTFKDLSSSLSITMTTEPPKRLTNGVSPKTSPGLDTWPAAPGMVIPDNYTSANNFISPSPGIINVSHRRVVTRDFMQSLLKEALRSDHPLSEVHTETELGETIQITIRGPKGELQRKTIHVLIEDGIPDVIVTEEHHLQFVLLKVIDNALKFTESGNITIAAKMGKTSQTIEVWIADDGCGMTEESKTYLFKPHFQEDASTSRSKDGLGLSLFNAKAHVRRNLGGDLTLEHSATEGDSKGSQFLIRVPISTPDIRGLEPPFLGTPPPHHSQPARPPLYSNPSLESITTDGTTTSSKSSWPSPPKPTPARKRVAFNKHLAEDYPLKFLIAEDNAINRNVAIGSLNKLGYSNKHITLAVDGVEAVRQYEASLSKPREDRFSAILMDIWMPNMDGYEATSKILDLARNNGENTTVIAVTADITGDCADKAKEVGMQGFLAKPYKVLDIEHLIVEHFKKLEISI